MHTLRLVPFALVLVGCGPSTFTQFCEQSVDAQCRQLFRCDEASAKNFYQDVADCQKSLRTSANCGQFESLSCSIDTAKANTCIRDIEQATCSSTFTLPPSCQAQVCNQNSTGSDGGTKVSCRSESGGSSSMNGMSTCSTTLSGCTDGKQYGLVCTSGGGMPTSCSCRVDGTETKNYEPMPGVASCGADARSSMQTTCEFPLK